ncbi:uncharacterized protein HMPREF1541_02684 [Cyphellophora europaea CBS 101466]|uniref:Methylated-DNA--protein-cysteine methyltransferase n=1 Tax=Cyphellophora europaea (strain CBS 101466) TaxID=1220924 RepID=W2S4K2_CYPE1|nr:uncharacterized protein HMPREF1541_02684 [Cyphellophora europaea CBS 101466]ETN43525.1 hypothetical protein HMPREF1541_02684 [Cyphellophora europaea CBS 101466]
MAATKHLPPSSTQHAKRTTFKSRSSKVAAPTKRTSSSSSKPKPQPMSSTATTKTTVTSNPESPFSANRTHIPTPYQTRVYAHLLCIPPGRVSTYASLARALGTSSPRAVGGALRTNPFAPEIPCHRVIASTGYVGGFIGEWEKAPSGFNQTLKLRLLREEGVEFDANGKLVSQDVWFDGPWDTSHTEGEIQTRIAAQADKAKQAKVE